MTKQLYNVLRGSEALWENKVQINQNKTILQTGTHGPEIVWIYEAGTVLWRDI